MNHSSNETLLFKPYIERWLEIKKIERRCETFCRCKACSNDEKKAAAENDNPVEATPNSFKQLIDAYDRATLIEEGKEHLYHMDLFQEFLMEEIQNDASRT